MRLTHCAKSPPFPEVQHMYSSLSDLSALLFLDPSQCQILRSAYFENPLKLFRVSCCTMSSPPRSEGQEQASGEKNPTPAPQPPIPDGGFNAYLQVLGAHLLFFNSWQAYNTIRCVCLPRTATMTDHAHYRGIINTFGVYQAYYSTAFLSHETASAISWVGTLQGFLLITVGILSVSKMRSFFIPSRKFLGAFEACLGSDCSRDMSYHSFLIL